MSTLLEVEGMSKIFGGLVAVNELDFTVDRGSVVGLIGPNGAGKTTVFNCITGNYVPERGDILFNGQSIRGRKPHTIVELGIARTFQTIRLFGHLSVLENVLAGRHCRLRSGFFSSMFRLPSQRREEQEAVERCMKELKFVDNTAGILVKKIKPDFKKLGPRYGKIMKALAATIQSMSQEDINAFEKAGTFTLMVDGQEAVLERTDVEIISEDIPGWLVANEGRLTVALDITVTEDLRKEGLARELVNRIQNLRKSSGFDITDKIHVSILSCEEMDEAIHDYKDYIANQVLAESIEIMDNAISDATELDFEDFKLSVKIEKA